MAKRSSLYTQYKSLVEFRNIEYYLFYGVEEKIQPSEEGFKQFLKEFNMKTFGQQRVDYKDSDSEQVKGVKQMYADLIDNAYDSIEPQERSEKARLVNIVATDLEKTCMMHVRSLYK